MVTLKNGLQILLVILITGIVVALGLFYGEQVSRRFPSWDMITNYKDSVKYLIIGLIGLAVVVAIIEHNLKQVDNMANNPNNNSNGSLIAVLFFILIVVVCGIVFKNQIMFYFHKFFGWR